MITDKDRNSCTGCTACVNVCPRKCIAMKSDEKGFLYPCIDMDSCIGCGACDNVCETAGRSADPDMILKGYGAIAKDRDLQIHSSSGGIFTLLSNTVIAEGGVVFGAVMTNDHKSAEHIAVYSGSDIAALRGAKYLQSDLSDCYSRAGELLHDGRTVLFSGTPCEIDGLKAFLGEENDNLLCVDMICHGVPSPQVWKKYCKEVEKKHNGRIKSVNFRLKKYSWEKPRVDHKGEKCKTVFHSKNEDPFMRLFLRDYILRPSCYECTHKGISRKSDITLGDFWGVDKVAPGFSDGAGTSLVIVHTEKGMRYFDKIRGTARIVEVDPVKAVAYNGSAVKSAPKPQKADEFWSVYQDQTVDALANLFSPISSNIKAKELAKHSSVYGLIKKNKKLNMENGIAFEICSENA